MARRALLGAAISGGLLAVAAASLAEEGEIYRWTDERGVVRYTPDRGRVPLSARDTLEVVRPEPAAAESNGAPTRPGALPALMGRKLPEQLMEPAEEPQPVDRDELDQRIAELRSAIEREQAELRGLVAEPDGAADAPGAEERDGRIREIANRLPKLQEELARLERIRSGTGVGLEP